MFIRLSAVGLIFAVAVLATPVRRNAAQVVSDIQNGREEMQVLDNSILVFDGTVKNLLAVHDDVLRLDDVLKATTKDVTLDDPYTDEQADTIIAQVEQAVLVIRKGLDDLVARKSAFHAIFADPLVLNDLELLKTDTDAAGTAIKGRVPADKEGGAQALLDEIDRAFAPAISAYSH